MKRKHWGLALLLCVQYACGTGDLAEKLKQEESEIEEQEQEQEKKEKVKKSNDSKPKDSFNFYDLAFELPASERISVNNIIQAYREMLFITLRSNDHSAFHEIYLSKSECDLDNSKTVYKAMKDHVYDLISIDSRDGYAQPFDSGNTALEFLKLGIEPNKFPFEKTFFSFKQKNADLAFSDIDCNYLTVIKYNNAPDDLNKLLDQSLNKFFTTIKIKN